MSQSLPTQPNQSQYQISVLDLFPVFATRAAFQQATGQQAPPFDATQPVKHWADPAPSGQPYLVFDSTAVASGYLNQLTLPPDQAARLNLPGTYIYPAYVSPPTDAMQYGPFGPIGAVSPDQVCLQGDAQEIANEIAPLYPGQTPVVSMETNPIYHYVYGSDPRRQWIIQIGVVVYVAQALIELKNLHGVGAPGHWVLKPPAGTATAGTVDWVQDQTVTTAPANAATVPDPIRPLLPNEQIVSLPPGPFSPQKWLVERTDLPQPASAETTDQQFADMKATLAAIQTSLAALRAKLGV